MTEKCQYCASKRVVPVLYERMDKANYIRGNKFRLRCQECERWLPCTSAETWREHDNPQILPAGIDPNDPELVPAVETDYAEQLSTNDGPAEEELNRFECPNGGCTAVHVGYPDECNVCEIPYEW